MTMNPQNPASPPNPASLPSRQQRAKELRELADLLEDPTTGPHFSALVWGVALNLPAIFQPQAMFSPEGSASRLALQEGDPHQVRLIVQSLDRQVNGLPPSAPELEAGVSMRIGSSTESLGDRDAMAALRDFVQVLALAHSVTRRGEEG